METPSRKPDRDKNANSSQPGITRRAAIRTLSAAGLLAAAKRSATAEDPPATRGERRDSGLTILKSQAINDYQISMQQFGGQLSCPIEQLIYADKNERGYQFDVIVIGSGYGASIAAARLSSRLKPGRRLAVIERGKEWTPGTFGDTLKETREQSRFTLLGNNRMDINNPTGLVNLVQNEEVNVLTGNGLGGTSLLNANVALRPDREVFNVPQWPVALRDRSVLDPYYDLAAAELGIVPAPFDGTAKMRAQRLAVEKMAHLGAHYSPADVAVTFDGSQLDAEGRNRHGVIQRPCTNCGDCTIGCNVGAKNTLQMNYLPMARRNGAEIYTRTEVVSMQKRGDHYNIYLKHYRPAPNGEFETIYPMVTSRAIVLGAGSLGSTEVLLRSWGSGLEFSKTLGWNWTGNGDALGFVLNSDHPTNIGGFGAYPANGPPVGPTIQTNVRFPDRANFRDRVLIQDGAIARAYANLGGVLHHDLNLQSTMVLLGMGHDGGNGRVVLRDGGYAEVKWPGLKEGAYRKYIRAHFEEIAKAHGGKYKYLKIYGDNFVSVHPLGGCNMSDDPGLGVVNHKGQVFDGQQGGYGAIDENGAGVHAGLYVADGSIVPNSLAANPYFTISALSERISHIMMTDPANADLFV